MRILVLMLIVVSAITNCALSQGQVCAPIEDGPYLDTQPILYLYITEADDYDGIDPNNMAYKAEVKVHGSYPADFDLKIKADKNFVKQSLFDPLDYFQIVEENNKAFVQLSRSLDRDGATPYVEDDAAFFPVQLVCNEGKATETIIDARIIIKDLNDNLPYFPDAEDDYESSVSESFQVGSIVRKVTALDKDENLDENGNSSLLYSLEDVSKHFQIDQNSGDITLIKQLDYEMMGDSKHIELTVIAKDGGSVIQNEVKRRVVVHVEDSDDEDPEFVYTGCFKHKNRCAWPKYTAALSLKKEQSITTFPVPNKIGSAVQIQARDSDLGIDNQIHFKISSTIPPGSEGKFRIHTTKTGDLYTAEIEPLSDMLVSEGFEIFLEAEEQSESKKHAIAMIYFTSGQSNTNSLNQNADDDYSDQDIALIVVTAILATLVLCLLIALICLCLRRQSGGKANIAMNTHF